MKSRFLDKSNTWLDSIKKAKLHFISSGSDVWIHILLVRFYGWKKFYVRLILQCVNRNSKNYIDNEYDCEFYHWPSRQPRLPVCGPRKLRIFYRIFTSSTNISLKKTQIYQVSTQIYQVLTQVYQVLLTLTNDDIEKNSNLPCFNSSLPDGAQTDVFLIPRYKFSKLRETDSVQRIPS